MGCKQISPSCLATAMKIYDLESYTGLSPFYVAFKEFCMGCNCFLFQIICYFLTYRWSLFALCFFLQACSWSTIGVLLLQYLRANYAQGGTLLHLTLKRVLASLVDIDSSLHNFSVNWSDTNLFPDISSCLKGLGQCVLLLALSMTF